MDGDNRKSSRLCNTALLFNITHKQGPCKKVQLLPQWSNPYQQRALVDHGSSLPFCESQRTIPDAFEVLRSSVDGFATALGHTREVSGLRVELYWLGLVSGHVVVLKRHSPGTCWCWCWILNATLHNEVVHPRNWFEGRGLSSRSLQASCA